MCYHHALFQNNIIPRTKTFSCQPICQGIRFRSVYNVLQTFLYEQYQSQNIPLHASRIHTTLYTSTQSYYYTYQDIFHSSLSPPQEKSSETKLSHSSLLHPHALHTSLSTSKYYLKIDSIKSDHFPLGKNMNKWNQLKQLDSNTNSSRNVLIFTYLRSGLELGSNRPLARSRYISHHATTRVPYYFYFYTIL